MYRLLKFKKTHIQNLQALSVNNSVSNNFVGEKKCSLCQKLHNFHSIFVRNQSTHTNPNVKQRATRKKRSKSVKSYAELLVVTDQSTTQQKAQVKRLSPADLKVFATTDFNLGELYKLKSLRRQRYVEEHTYHNLTVIESLPVISEPMPDSISSPSSLSATEVTEDSKEPVEMGVLNDLDDVKILNNLDSDIDGMYESELEALEMTSEVLENVKSSHLGTFQPEPEEEAVGDVTEAAESKEPKTKSTDPTAREEVISRTLAAYIDVCAYQKMPQRGLNAFMFHRSRSKRTANKNFPPVKSVNVINALLKGFAAKGNYNKVNEILTYAIEDEINLNLQSYAFIFECLGRADVRDSHLKQIRIHAKEAQRDGFSFDAIMNNGMFLGDQRAVVFKAMKLYNPNYNVKFDLPPIQYENSLVNGLNHLAQLDVPKVEHEIDGLFTPKLLEKTVSDQMEAERQGFLVVKSIEAREDPSEEVIKYRQAFNEHFEIWEKAASEAFQRDLMALAARKAAITLQPYLKSIPSRDFVQIIVEEAKKITEGSETYSPTCHQLYRDLGTKVYARYKVLLKQKTGVLDKVIKIHKEYCNQYANSRGELDVLPNSVDHLNTRQRWQWIDHLHKREGATIAMDHQQWVPTVLHAVGKFLYNIIIHDLKINVNVMSNKTKHKNFQPGFYTIFRTQGRISKEEIKPHPVLSKLYRASVPETLTFAANEVPMRCPPIPWISVHTGGYLVAACDVMRLPYQATTQKQRLGEAPPTQLYPALDSLNQLGSVPWKVNTKILDVILEVFNTGGSSKLDVPEPPSALPPPPPVTPDMDKTQKYLLFRQRLQHKRKRGEMYSLWCDCLYRLSLANHFRNDIFWLPHNMDFRGRVYPIPPHLNHLGSDLARSMLVFAESRPLGPEGLDWLKLHLVNLTGLKKRDRVYDRLVFANEVMDKILDSADNPLTGKMWWAESEEPWQTLACCMEIAAAHRSPDPEKHRTYFPVHQDGSCNGLQHYAALGRDSAGAHSVNLTPSEVPQDVYSAVVTLVEQQREKDAKSGVEIAKVLEGFVKRKVIKQTIMTTVYGVTRFGARLQIARQLKDLDDFPKEHVWAASSYLTGRTFDSLRTMFTSTKEIQDWFTECARLISSVSGQHVEWVTPLGLPIVQPYNRFRKFNPSSVFEPFHMDKYEKPNVMKQKNAFPPNFIHSLDSSHMMLTSLHCKQAGITFMSVHDCYWTHPSTVPIMNKICREQFVALHSEPILEDLSLFLSDKYSYATEQLANDGSVVDLTKRKLNRVLRRLPNTGDFDIKKVLQSVYFFS